MCALAVTEFNISAAAGEGATARNLVAGGLFEDNPGLAATALTHFGNVLLHGYVAIVTPGLNDVFVSRRDSSYWTETGRRQCAGIYPDALTLTRAWAWDGPQLAINANFYDFPEGTVAHDIPCAKIMGLSMSDGAIVSQPLSPIPAAGEENPRKGLSCLLFNDENQAQIRDDVILADFYQGHGLANIRNAVAGTRLITNSTVAEVLGPAPVDANARTAVGIRGDGNLVIVVIERRPANETYTGSSGVVLNELANFMIALGTVNAVNFDGSGSTSFVLQHFNGHRSIYSISQDRVARPHGDIRLNNQIGAADTVRYIAALTNPDGFNIPVIAELIDEESGNPIMPRAGVATTANEVELARTATRRVFLVKEVGGEAQFFQSRTYSVVIENNQIDIYGEVFRQRPCVNHLGFTPRVLQNFPATLRGLRLQGAL